MFKQLFGKNIYKDSYVIYNKDSELSKINVGVWKVIRREHDYLVEIKNPLTNNSFVTSTGKLININNINIDDLKRVLNLASFKYVRNNKLHSGITYRPFINASDDNDSEYIFEEPQNYFIKLKENEKMSMNTIVKANTTAVKNGALISAGNTLNSVVKNKLVSTLPKKYKKIAESPLADIVVANIAEVAVQQFAATNPKARMATQAMMEAAMVNLFNSFNFEKIIAEVLESVNMDGLVDSFKDNG